MGAGLTTGACLFRARLLLWRTLYGHIVRTGLYVHMYEIMKRMRTMTKFHRRLRRRDAGTLMVMGAATITLDQGLKMPMPTQDRDAMAGDWNAVGRYLRHAVDHAANFPAVR